MKTREVSAIIKANVTKMGDSYKFHTTDAAMVRKIRSAAYNTFYNEDARLSVTVSGDEVKVTMKHERDGIASTIRGMAQGEVTHFDLDMYDTLRAYSKREGVSVRKVVEVVKL